MKYRIFHIFSVLSILLLFTLSAFAQQVVTLETMLGAPYPSGLMAAKTSDKLFWTGYEKGLRNIFMAEGPDFDPVQVTDFPNDDGDNLTGLQVNADGSLIVYVRGGDPNGDSWRPNPTSPRDWVENPSSDPDRREQWIMAQHTDGSAPWKLAQGNDPVLSPCGNWIMFVKDGKLMLVSVYPAGMRSHHGNGVRQLIRIHGTVRSPQWSPDGSKIAFVSDRDHHAFIGVYDREIRKIIWMAPGVDRDGSPVWSPDGKKLAFIRRPGNAYPGPPVFADGHVQEIWTADAETGDGALFWQPDKDGLPYHSISNLHWTKSGHILFRAEHDIWGHFFSIEEKGGEPKDITPGESFVEHYAISHDGKTLYYSSNEQDIDRRHIWRVRTNGKSRKQLTKGTDIETVPVPLANGKRLAIFSAGPKTPQSVALIAEGGGKPFSIWPDLSSFPVDDLVVPEQIIIESADGFMVHCQLFLPKGAKAGDRLPAVVFLHGGPRRQMLLGFHYRHYYTNTYGFNQHLATKGYAVLSVNYRRGIGYGRDFRMAPNTGTNGCREYEDVLNAGLYLSKRPEVDPEKVGLWGGSYGGYLTAMGLAKNSDVFKAGVDLNGVHLRGRSTDPEDISFQSSPVAYMETWTSPVFLSHGDDDRNVPFSQTVLLVELLRKHGVYYELQVFPDEVHDYMIHTNLLEFYNDSSDFFDRFLKFK